MDPNTVVSILSPAMAIILFLNLLIGAGSVLAAGGSLGPIKLSPAAATYLAPVVAIGSGTVGFITQQATSDATKASFHFTVMLIVTALLVGFGHWLVGAAAGRAVQHHIDTREIAKARATADATKPAVTNVA